MARVTREESQLLKWSLGIIGLGRKQKLNTEITDEIRLIAARGLEAPSGHEEENHRPMNFVATSKVDGGLVFGRMEGSLRINFHVAFEFWSEIVAHHEPGEPAVRSFVGKLISDFVVHIDPADFFGEFERQKENFTRRRNPAMDGIIGIVEEQLGENRDVKAGLAGVVEMPFYPGVGLTEPILGLGRRVSNPEPGVFIGKLNVLANAEIKVDVGSVRDRLIAIEKRHVAKIDFPIEMPGSARIVGVVGRAALSS